MLYKNTRHLLIATALLTTLISGCASDSHTAQGAVSGGTTGAVTGAVGGLVSALVFGGDPLERAAEGAVYGGAIGATAGAISGSKRDKQAEQTEQAETQKLRERIGDDTFAGLEALANCDHNKALSQASLAQQSNNPDYSLAGTWLEVLTFADAKNEVKARSLFPTLIEKDKKITSAAQAEEKMRNALNDLMKIRKKYKLPEICG